MRVHPDLRAAGLNGLIVTASFTKT